MSIYLQGSFSVDGLPRNGATVSLYPAGAFSTAPSENTALPPASSLLDTTQTSAAHGYDGAYRFSVVPPLEAWAGVSWNGLTTWQYHLVPSGTAALTVKSYGAIGNGVADDTTAIQAAINACATVTASGGVVLFPPGTFRITQPLEIPGPDVFFFGTGKRNCQSSLPQPTGQTAAYNTSVPSTIFCDIPASSGAIHLSHTKNINGFQTRDLTFLGNAAMPARCFDFDLGGNGAFRRDFLFANTTVQGFNAAFELHQSSTESGTSAGAMGVIRIVHSSVMHNNWIALTSNSKQWNGFVFERNEAGQNGAQVGQGGINISAHAVQISDNVLEGQRDPIQLAGGYRGVTIKNNYFEAVSGSACIFVTDSRGPLDIGPNTFINLATDQPVKINHSQYGIILDAYFCQNAFRVNPPLPFTNTGERVLNSASTSGFYSRVDAIDGALGRPPYASGAITLDTSFNGSSPAPLGLNTLPATTGLTTGTGIYTKLYSGVSASGGQWVVACWALKRDSAASTDPVVSFRVNDTGPPNGGGADMTFYYYNEHARVGEWLLITAAVQPTIAASSIMLYLYPYGISPASGLLFSMRYPALYVVNNLNDVRPYFPLDGMLEVSAAPTVGTWARGDRLYNTAPASGQPLGWACTAAGTPGTWLPFSTL